MVRFDISTVSFPEVCPVCLNEATCYAVFTFGTTMGTNTSLVHHPIELSPQVFRSESRRFRTVRIPVCDDHEFIPDEFSRLRLICVLGTIVSALLAWAAFAIIRGSSILGEPIPGWTFLAIGWFILALLVTAFLFSPSPVEKAVDVIYFDLDGQLMYVDFKSPEYQRLFLKRNPRAELVDEIEIKSS